MAEIVIERSGVEIHRVVVRGDMTIGRDPATEIHLDDRALSRHHARLVTREGALFVVDLNSQNGVFVNGARIEGGQRVDPGAVVTIGRYTLRRVDTGVNPALAEETSPDSATKKPTSDVAPRVEVLDDATLRSALPHVKIGRHFVFVDDAQAVLPPNGRMQRLLGYKQKKGRTVKALCDAPVELAGARIHPAPFSVERTAGLACDRDLYRAETDVVRLLITAPGASVDPRAGDATALVRIAMNGAPLSERVVEIGRGVALESFAALLPGKYEARLVIDGVEAGEPARFTVATYTLAPLSARLHEQRLDRATQSLTVSLAVESYGVAWDRPLRAALIDNGREMSEVALSMERPGRFTGKARAVGDGPFKVRLAADDDPARTADVALPGTRRKERQLTLAGELGKELFVSLLPEPNALALRGLFVSQGDFLATPVVIDDVVADGAGRAVLRANEDIEALVVAAFDPARDAWSIFDLGDVQRGKSATLDVPRPMCVAFVGCFVDGEPFEAFTSLFAAERPVSVTVPDTVAPGAEITMTVRTGRSVAIPMIVCVRDERLTATDTPLTALASSTKRAIEAASAGLGDSFRFRPLADLLAAPRAMPLRGADGFGLKIAERGSGARTEAFHQDEITIGRVAGNDVVLPRANISKRHARIVLRDGKFIIVDLKSTNGTYVNGKRITSPQVLKEGDRVYAGDFTLQLVPGAEDTVYLGAGVAKSARAGDVFDGEGHDDPELFEELPSLAAEEPPGDVAWLGDDDASAEGPDVENVLEQFRAVRNGVAADDDMDPSAPPSPAKSQPLPASRSAPPVAASKSAPSAPHRSAPPAPAKRAVDAVAEDAFDDDGEAKTRSLGVREVARGSAKPAVASSAVSPRQGAVEGAAAEVPEVRATFPEVLFCGLVDVADGAEIRVPAGDSLGAFAVELFFVDGGDFGQASARVQVDKAVRVDLDLAPEIDPDDKVTGTLRASAKNGGVRVSLVRDGRAVPLRTVDGRMIAASDVLPPGIELVFDAGPGVWLATATDPASGEVDAMEVRVGAPGVYRTLAREIVLLEKGKRMVLDGDMLSLRVLPGIDEPFAMLAEATAGYQHMCCEQTAAKILSAVVMFLSADDLAPDPAPRQRAEEIIIAGIARERSMYRKNRGFSMYPEQSGISDHYTPRVVQYLWSLDGLADVAGLSRTLQQAVMDGIAMADDVAHAFAMKRVPERVETMEDAYALALREPRRQREALELVARTVAVDDSGARLRAPTHRVAERATLAYAAAVLFASGKTATAIKIANDVLRQLNEQGRLYSTVDSVAAIALMVQLKKTGIAGGSGSVVVNGKAMIPFEASLVSDQIEVIEVKEGVVVVEVTRAKEERWADTRSAFPLKIGFRDDAGRPTSRFRAGDKADLVVQLPKGYSEGDLVHVCLPPSMAWLEGGARVKRFTADFAGRDELRVPVVVTHAIRGRQRFAVAVRNMFQEERAASPGIVVIEGA